MINNSTNLNKTNIHLSSLIFFIPSLVRTYRVLCDIHCGPLCKHRFKQWWSTMPSVSTKRTFTSCIFFIPSLVRTYRVLCDIHYGPLCKHRFKQWWSTMPSISTKRTFTSCIFFIPSLVSTYIIECDIRDQVVLATK